MDDLLTRLDALRNFLRQLSEMTEGAIPVDWYNEHLATLDDACEALLS